MIGDKWKECPDDTNAAVLSASHTDFDYAWIHADSIVAETINAVDRLNEMLDSDPDDHCIMFIMEYSSFCQSIKFGSFILWNSEFDDRECDENGVYHQSIYDAALAEYELLISAIPQIPETKEG